MDTYRKIQTVQDLSGLFILASLTSFTLGWWIGNWCLLLGIALLFVGIHLFGSSRKMKQ
jgi:hypothetical protein